MLEAVFISDLHLHPEEPVIEDRLFALLSWAATHTQSLYILGDFFHAWAGDDDLTPWSQAIAERLRQLAQQGVAIYFIHGNRDFLLGRRFAELAGLCLLPEEYVLHLNGVSVLLAHGDQYCSTDKSHQRFRKLTRNKLFSRCFLALPLGFRQKIVHQVRQRSTANYRRSMALIDVVADDLLQAMNNAGVTNLIHGHTHQPARREHTLAGRTYQQYILSAWDDIPDVLCYDKTIGFYFERLDSLLLS